MASGKFGSGTTGVSWEGMDAAAFRQSLERLTSQEILVGIPEEKADRDDGAEVNNATIGYMAEFGVPEKNIPARAWLQPAIRENADKISGAMLAAGKAVAQAKDSSTGDKMLHEVGMLVVSMIKRRIQQGIQPPLSERTLIARSLRVSRGRKGSIRELEARAQGEAPSTEFAKPLIDTGLFLKSINYVVKKISRGD